MINSIGKAFRAYSIEAELVLQSGDKRKLLDFQSRLITDMQRLRESANAFQTIYTTTLEEFINNVEVPNE